MRLCALQPDLRFKFTMVVHAFKGVNKKLRCFPRGKAFSQAVEKEALSLVTMCGHVWRDFKRGVEWVADSGIAVGWDDSEQPMAATDTPLQGAVKMEGSVTLEGPKASFPTWMFGFSATCEASACVGCSPSL